MTCYKWPDWFAKKEKCMQKPGSQGLQRTLDERDDLSDPVGIISRFETALAWDGFDWRYPEEVVVVLHLLQKCEAWKCAAVISSYLDFLEEQCSPDGEFDESLIDDLWSEHSDKMNDLCDQYMSASREEGPEDRIKRLKEAGEI